MNEVATCDLIFEAFVIVIYVFGRLNNDLGST